MPLNPDGIFYADTSTEMSIADITSAMATSIGDKLGGIEQTQTVNSQAERDLLYPTPVQGNSVFRNDLGFIQTYYGAWNATTNPGGRGSVAAWYDNQRNMGLVPIVPPTVNVSGGSATANTLGVVSFTSATSISLNGCFTAGYTNYLLIFDYETSVNAANGVRLRSAGADDTSSNYVVGRTYQDDNTGGFQNTGGQSAWGTTPTGSVRQFVAEMLITRPFQVAPTGGRHIGIVAATKSSGAKMSSQIGNHLHQASTSFDGITIYPTTGTMTGTVQVLGYNS